MIKENKNDFLKFFSEIMNSCEERYVYPHLLLKFTPKVIEENSHDSKDNVPKTFVEIKLDAVFKKDSLNEERVTEKHFKCEYNASGIIEGGYSQQNDSFMCTFDHLIYVNKIREKKMTVNRDYYIYVELELENKVQRLITLSTKTKASDLYLTTVYKPIVNYAIFMSKKNKNKEDISLVSEIKFKIKIKDDEHNPVEFNFIHDLISGENKIGDSQTEDKILISLAQELGYETKFQDPNENKLFDNFSLDRKRQIEKTFNEEYWMDKNNYVNNIVKEYKINSDFYRKYNMNFPNFMGDHKPKDKIFPVFNKKNYESFFIK